MICSIVFTRFAFLYFFAVLSIHAATDQVIYQATFDIKNSYNRTILLEEGAQIIASNSTEAVARITYNNLKNVALRGLKPHDTTKVSMTILRMEALQSSHPFQVQSIDTDGDGLTDVEEEWWGTDPREEDSDNDTISDGEEIKQLLAGNNIHGYPFKLKQTPEGKKIPPAYDSDSDMIPDQAEILAVGTNPNRESSDGDRYDDGHELFGRSEAGYGSLPHTEDLADFPTFVLPPGNSPFCAAAPEIEITVDPDFVIIMKTTVYTDETITEGDSITIQNSTTKGKSQSVSSSHAKTLQSWQEVRDKSEEQKTRETYRDNLQRNISNYSEVHILGQSTREFESEENEFEIGGKVGISLIGPYAEAYAKDTYTTHSDRTSIVETQNISSENSTIEMQIKEGEKLRASYVFGNETIKGQGQETTFTSTVTYGSYVEQTIAKANTISSERGWRTGRADNMAETAELRFTFRIRNVGTDVARELKDLFFNVYIGDATNPIASTAAFLNIGEQVQPLIINFLLPGMEDPVTITTVVNLSYQDIHAIDSGQSVRISVERFSYSGWEGYHQQNIPGNCVLFEIDDGTEDGDETIDKYLLYTKSPSIGFGNIGNESYLDILQRYFQLIKDSNGNLQSIVVPEISQFHQHTGTYHEFEITDISWIQVYLQNPTAPSKDTSLPLLKDVPAFAKTRVALIYNCDSDQDGYSDRIERHYNTEWIHDADLHPNPLIKVKADVKQNLEQFSIRTSICNEGNFPARDVCLRLLSSNNSYDIRDNFAGGAVKIAPGELIEFENDLISFCVPETKFQTYDYLKDVFLLLTYSTPPGEVRKLLRLDLYEQYESSSDDESLRWISHLPKLSPGKRHNHVMVFDSYRGQVVLFGGFDKTCLRDTWEWNGSEWNQVDESSGPEGRYYTAMAYDPTQKKTILFGGKNGRYFDDTWEWDGYAWKERLVGISKPSARCGHAMVYDAARENIVLFGGEGNGNETWLWDGINWKLASEEGPTGCIQTRMAYDTSRQKVVLFGGHDKTPGTPQILGETWEWDGTKWNNVTPEGFSPTPRVSSAMAYDEQLKKVILFGGSAGTTIYGNNIWGWNGSNWEEINIVNNFNLKRAGHTMVYDKNKNNLLLFGGFDNSLILGDTWTLQKQTSPSEFLEQFNAPGIIVLLRLGLFGWGWLRLGLLRLRLSGLRLFRLGWGFRFITLS